jgi:hypothetical protein
VKGEGREGEAGGAGDDGVLFGKRKSTSNTKERDSRYLLICDHIVRMMSNASAETPAFLLVSKIKSSRILRAMLHGDQHGDGRRNSDLEGRKFHQYFSSCAIGGLSDSSLWSIAREEGRL